jgi:hypothetical protein
VGALAAADIVSIWELGQHRPDWSKALIALAPALPEARPSELAALTVGERNAHLLALRRDLIGPVMHAMVKCPVCGEPLEFEQRIDELLDGYAAPAEREFSFSSGDYAARCRLLTSDDLAYAAALGGEPNARLLLIERAMLESSRAGVPIDAADVPDKVVDLLSGEIAERDPLAHVAIPLSCAACSHVWTATFQIVPFLWTELDRKARQLLEDVVTLARFYGWSEAQVLELSAARRQYYLDSIG